MKDNKPFLVHYQNGDMADPIEILVVEADYLPHHYLQADGKHTTGDGRLLKKYCKLIDNNMKKELQGYWNGQPATFVGVNYTVLAPGTETWWTARFIGHRRQGIRVTYNNECFVIDNENGDGYYKVTTGFGSPRVSHKDPGIVLDAEIISNGNLKTVKDHKALEIEHNEHTEWIRENHPEVFKKLEALKAGLAKLHIDNGGMRS